jgi:hypothetical protein
MSLTVVMLVIPEFNISGKIVKLAVVLPAPWQPEMM